ncbi:MAG: hypothetical protein Q9227_008699 [Pyrenula ochraceoflavens]
MVRYAAESFDTQRIGRQRSDKHDYLKCRDCSKNDQSKILNIPILCTTQSSAKLGGTVPEIADMLPEGTPIIDKTAFSMLTPDLVSHLPLSPNTPGLTILLLGIESHICISQTTLDLLSLSASATQSRPPPPPLTIYLLADGISSCNPAERRVALRRLSTAGMAQEGEGKVVLTSSEAAIFELLGDAAHEGFREVSRVVRECKEETGEGVRVLMGDL